VLKEKDSPEGTGGFLSVCQHASQTPREVEPTERPFHLPPLAARAPVVDILGRATTTEGDRVLARGNDWYDAPLAHGPAVGVAIVAFVQPQAFGVALTVTEANAIDRLQHLDDISAGGFTQGEGERMAIGINHQRALQPFNAGLSGVADFFIRPF
jgi:hypothetical protein